MGKGSEQVTHQKTYIVLGRYIDSERSAGKGTGYPLQYSWASRVAQLVKNLPAMRETCVQSLLRRCPGEGKGYPLQYSGLENFMDYSPWGCQESDTTEQLSVFTFKLVKRCSTLHYM